MVARRPARRSTTPRCAPTSPPTWTVPTPPFFGTRVVKGIPLADYAALLDERATFLGQWGLRGARGGSGPSYEELVETEGRPRLRYWLDRLAADQVLEAAVVYGYFPAYSEGNDLVVLDENGARRAGPVHLPAPAPRAPAVPGRLLPARGRGELGRGRVAAGHRRAADQRVRGEAVRRATPTATTSRCTACRCS